MKVLIVHDHYRIRSGEDAVVSAEAELLRQKGEQVDLFCKDSSKIRGILSAVAVAWRLPYREDVRREIRYELERIGPDIVHVHNTFPLLSPAVYDACLDSGIPVVQTLHNYRWLCASAVLSRNGRTCELCVSGSPYQAVLHRCYKGSPIQSAAVARMIAYHRKRGTWKDRVSRFIALTEFARDKFIEAGFPEDKISVKPNFVFSNGQNDHEDAVRHGAIYVGRISKEKGVDTLCRAWMGTTYPLSIVGGGELPTISRDIGPNYIEHLGERPSREVLERMKKSLFLVVPSEWYEGFPIVVVEAFSQGLPVVASAIGGLQEIISQGKTGLLFKPGDHDDLRRTISWAISHPVEMMEMGKNARKEFDDFYSSEANYTKLMNIYHRAKVEFLR